jgi:hypothetical protein
LIVFRLKKPVWRLNWSVIDDPELFQPETRPRPASAPPVTAVNAGQWLWVRMERQTLRRLPRSGDILFTIRIYRHPLADLADQPDRAARLAAALQGLDPDMAAYKSLEAYKEAAIEWLRQVGDSP